MAEINLTKYGITGTTEIVYKFSSGKAGAGSRFHSDNLIIPFAAEFFAHKRRNQTAQIRATAGTADDHICFHAVFIQSGFGFQTDDGLMKQYLIEDAAQYISVAILFGSHFYGFRNGAAQTAGCTRMLCKDFSENPCHEMRAGRLCLS